MTDEQRRIRFLMLKFDLNKADIGKIIGVSDQMVSRYLANHRATRYIQIPDYKLEYLEHTLGAAYA